MSVDCTYIIQFFTTKLQLYLISYKVQKLIFNLNLISIMVLCIRKLTKKIEDQEMIEHIIPVNYIFYYTIFN